VPSLPAIDNSFAEMKARIDKTIDFLKGLKADQLDGREDAQDWKASATPAPDGSPQPTSQVCTRLSAGGRSLERTRLWSTSTRSGDRPGEARGEGGIKNGGSTPCTSSHRREKYVRAAQDRWAPQPEEISPARQEDRENRALGRHNSIQKRTAPRLGLFPP
jgi:hypothetical protein